VYALPNDIYSVQAAGPQKLHHRSVKQQTLYKHGKTEVCDLGSNP